MQIKIDFENPTKISTSKYDEIKVNFVDTTLLFDSEG